MSTSTSDYDTRESILYSDYWRSYGMQYDPFNARFREDFFSVPQWHAHYNLAEHLVKHQNVLLVVTGQQQCGKTTFMRHFQTHIREQLNTYQLEGEHGLSSEELLRIVTQVFGLPKLSQWEGDPEKQFIEQIDNIEHSNRHCLLLIDDAHLLSEETLHTLLKLVKYQRNKRKAVFNIMLFAEPAMEGWTENIKLQGDGDLVHTIELPGLNLEETRAYLDYCLRSAGFKCRFPLSYDNLVRIHQLSRGYIGDINTIAQKILIDKLSAGEMPKGLTRRVVWPKKWLLIGSGAIIEGLIFLSSVSKDMSSSRTWTALKRFSFTRLSQTIPESHATTIPFSSKHEKWLNKPQQAAVTHTRKKKHYTIALLTSRHRRTSEKFIREHHLTKKAKYFKTRHHRKHYYVVVYGDYSNAQQAHRALHRLPQGLKRLNPQIRSFISAS